MSDPLQHALDQLPHGPEFRFLDHLLVLEAGRRATAEYTVRGSEAALAGHFPADPVFPGVLLIEAGAQLAGIVAQSSRSATRLRLTGVRSAKILGSAQPGQKILYEAQLIREWSHLVQAEVTARVGDKIILQAQVILSGEFSEGASA